MIEEDQGGPSNSIFLDHLRTPTRRDTGLRSALIIFTGRNVKWHLKFPPVKLIRTVEQPAQFRAAGGTLTPKGL